VTSVNSGGKSEQYQLQRNRVVEHKNLMLGETFRSLLLDRGQEEWDTVFSQVMRVYRSTPNTSTFKIPNYLLLGQKSQVPDHLTYHVPDCKNSVHEYMETLVEHMSAGHDMLREQQLQV